MHWRSPRQFPVWSTPTRAPVYTPILDEPAPQAWLCTEQCGNNRISADHGQLKRGLRAMRGLKTEGGATVVIRGPALVQNMRRGHYELAVGQPVNRRIAAAFGELAAAI
jgi:hypothetical protein